MQSVKLRIDNYEFQGILDENSVAIKIAPCLAKNAKDKIKKYTYGVMVDFDDKYIYFTRMPKSGLTDAGKSVINKIAPNFADKVDNNPIELYILAIIAAFVLVCSMNPEAPLCKTVTETAQQSWWYVILPLTAFGIGAYIAYKVLG